MNEYNSNLARLLKSQSPSAQLVGWMSIFFMFLPTAFQVAGDESLTIWQRLERLSIAAGQTFIPVLTLAVSPDLVTGRDEEKPPNE